MTPLGKYIRKTGLAQKDVARIAGLTPERLSGLCNDPEDLLYADDFYAIIWAVDGDLNDACNEIFNRYKLKTVEDIWDSDLGKYLFNNAKPTKAISDETNIKSARLSKLLNDPDKRPYAWEIYLIALSIKKKPSQVFESLYGNEKK